jgi:tetratricopeptide (TPR) repeat protein
MSHYSEDELSAFALRPRDLSDGDDVARHLDGCTHCRSALDGIEQFDASLRDPIAWEIADSMTIRREVPKNLLTQARALAAEDAEARELVTPAVESFASFRDARVTEDRRFHTLGVMRLLCRVANTTHERDPQFGLAIADAALAIAARLPEAASSGLPWHVGTAAKERANALRYLGRFREAEQALDAADASFRAADHIEPFDLAIVQYVRSLIYSETERFDEAIELARSAAAEFETYADVPRYLAARMAEAAAFYYADRDAEAAPIFEFVANAACASGDIGIAARALANAASCYARLHDHDRAADLYRDSLVASSELDSPGESARISWALAALRVERGDFTEGLAALDFARVALLRLGMVNDAALATLDLIAGLLVIGQIDRVPKLCGEITVTFAAERMMRNAKKALAYLNEAVTGGNGTPDTVRHVRAYLERLPHRPHEEFSQIQ